MMSADPKTVGLTLFLRVIVALKGAFNLTRGGTNYSNLPFFVCRNGFAGDTNTVRRLWGRSYSGCGVRDSLYLP